MMFIWAVALSLYDTCVFVYSISWLLSGRYMFRSAVIQMV
jgi:hypothetical protein